MMVMNALALTLPGVPLANALLFLLLGSAAAMVFGMGKVGFGGGVGILSVPMMIYACGGESTLAVGLMLPLMIVVDYAGIATWWRRWNLRAAVKLLPGLMVGIAAGAGLVRWLQQVGAETTTDAGLKLGIGVISLGFVVLRLLQWRLHRTWTFRPVAWQAGLAGSLVGLTSTLAHAAGPVATMYLIAQRMGKERFVATTVLLFWMGNQLKLVPYAVLGLVRADTLVMGLWLVPAVVVGAVLGRLLHRWIGERSFVGVIYALLAAAGMHLIVTSVQTLLKGC
ncbi:MAG: TSUP family transporter [Planctomycetes bacterium]|jgi:uncharacterized membrane protein YfcA|nr:TSUP family transporter [Planctomycetota bacterium]